MNRIQRLSPLLVDQIAAGEVIQGPHSVIKELVENSLDAGATRIEVALIDGGLSLIRVQDNGTGIHPEDISLALDTHATSKIHTWDDLCEVRTLGFRGEALATIRAVSRLTLRSRVRGEPQAYQTTVEGTECASETILVNAPEGTCVEVRDLFFNTPARRRFMRSERSEFLSADDVLRRLALNQMDCDFEWKHQNKTIVSVRAAHTHEARVARLSKLLGSWIQDSVYFEEESLGMRVWGWLSMPHACRPNNQQQYCSVNGRFLKDRMLLSVMRQLYAPYLPEGRYPAFVVFLELPSREVDVNVHPSKYEVRFYRWRWVQELITRSVLDALPPQTVTTFDESYTVYEPKMSVNSPASSGFPWLKQRYVCRETEEGFYLVDAQRLRALVCAQRWKDSVQQNTLKTVPVFNAPVCGLTAQEAKKMEQYQPLWETWGFSWLHTAEGYQLQSVPWVCAGIDPQTLMTYCLQSDFSASTEQWVHWTALIQRAPEMSFESIDWDSLLKTLEHKDLFFLAKQQGCLWFYPWPEQTSVEG